MTEQSEAEVETKNHVADEELPERFSLVAGGAFHALLDRFGLLDADGLPSRRAALGLAAIAWLVPALVVVLQTLMDPGYSGWDYFEDPTVYARYLVAIYIMVATERLADGRIAILIRYFRDAKLLDGPDHARFAVAVKRADLRAGSRRAEMIILAIALALSVTATRVSTEVSFLSWERVAGGEGLVALSWAGEVSAFSSNALFQFLMLRWFWRFWIWAALLRQTASLRLQLMPVHPDRCGGLGFLSIFPGIFSGLIFALSCVVGGSLAKAWPVVGHSEPMIWLAIATWLLLVLIIFLGPLLVFVRPLYLAREQALLTYGRMAHGHHLAFHRRWIDSHAAGEDILGSADPSSLSDLNASVQAAYEMGLFPIDRRALILLLGAAGIPMLVAAAFQMPLADLIKLIAGVLL